ncbi:MAG: hypothetical protein Q9220_005976 [cf. Caloplaca sp. 1 TL-2023]
MDSEPVMVEKQRDGGSKPESFNEKAALGLEKGRDEDAGIVKDGIRLHPEPTADPLDPLNWSSAKKHTILAIVMYLYFMFTYITTTTVPSFPELQEQLGISYSQVNWTVAIPALGLAVGPLFWSSLADIYGRRIIFLTGTLIAFAATIGAGAAEDYSGYMAARFFQGFGVSPGATVGLAVVMDLFFEHERGQKLGLWVLAIDTGLLVGPIIGGFIDLVSADWIQWLTAILFGVLLVLEFAFMPETLYPRAYMLNRMPVNTSSGAEIEKVSGHQDDPSKVELQRTTKLTILNFRPVPGMRHPKPWDSILRFILTFKLWLAYPAALLSAIGLIIWGISIDKAYHWIVGQIAFFLFAAGIQMGNTVITSYIVDSYPLQSMSVITFYSVFLNLSAFADPFFIAPWETKSGFTWSFAAQGIITFFGAVPIFAALHRWGGSLRAAAGQPSWVNPEYDAL